MAKGMPRLLSPAELKALRPVAPSAGGTVTLWGKPVPYQPLSVAIYDRFILSRFEAPNAFFTMGEQVEAARAAVEEIEAKGGTPDPELLRIIDGAAYTKAQATDGGAANMAFIACGIGAPGDTDIERQLLDAADEELEAALTAIEEATWGDNPSRFFAEVGRKRAGRIMLILQKARATESPTPGQSPSKATSTRTAGRVTTTTNRKTRRASQASSRKAR